MPPATFDAAALRTARQAAGLTQRALALQLGVAGGERVSAWEAGRDVPRDSLTTTIANVLGVPIEVLLPAARPVKILRLRADLAVGQLATAVGVSRRTVFRWEAGDYAQVPDDRVLLLLAEALAVPVIEVERAFQRGRTWEAGHDVVKVSSRFGQDRP